MKGKYFILLLAASAAAIVFVATMRKKEPGDFKGQVSMHSHQLLGICNEWLSKERSTNTSIIQFASAWADFGLLVYTTNIYAHRTNYPCIFAVRPETIQHRGLLAVTTNRTVIWIGDSGTVRVVQRQ